MDANEQKLTEILYKLRDVQMQLEKSQNDLEDLKNKRTGNWAYFLLILIWMNTCSVETPGKDQENEQKAQTTNIINKAPEKSIKTLAINWLNKSVGR